MSVDLREEGGVSVLDLHGKLTLGAPETEIMIGVLRDLLHAGRRKILLNMENIGHIDSMGLGVLVAHSKKAAEGGGVIKLLKPSERTSAMFHSTRLDQVFEIFENEAEALASF